MEQTSLIDSWPKISFEAIEKTDIDNQAAELFYASFFSLMHFPKTVVQSFWSLLRSKPEDTV